MADSDASADILNQGTQAVRRRPAPSTARSKPAESRSRERGSPEQIPADQRRLDNVTVMRDCFICSERKSDTRHVSHSGLDSEGYMCGDCRYVPPSTHNREALVQIPSVTPEGLACAVQLTGLDGVRFAGIPT